MDNNQEALYAYVQRYLNYNLVTLYEQQRTISIDMHYMLRCFVVYGENITIFKLLIFMISLI
jgi:hypothetical protein